MPDDFRQVPEPNYEYEISKLVAAYKQAVRDILRELERLDLTNISRANAQAALAEIARILKELDAEASAWVEENIPVAARDGVARAIFALGVVETMDEAVKIAKFNRINKLLVETAVADLQTDLLAISTNVERKVRTAVREVMAEVMRNNLTSGINGRRTLTREMLTRLRDRLGDAVNTGIIDAAGRRWRPEVFTEMAVRTKLMRTHMEATQNEAISRGALYGVISRHGATDGCRAWEGKIVRLSPDAPGNYPLLSELKGRRDIFHPNCKHLVNPTRRLDLLPNYIKQINSID